MTNAYRFNTPSVCRQRLTLMQSPQARNDAVRIPWGSSDTQLASILDDIGKKIFSETDQLGFCLIN